MREHHDDGRRPEHGERGAAERGRPGKEGRGALADRRLVANLFNHPTIIAGVKWLLGAKQLTDVEPRVQQPELEHHVGDALQAGLVDGDRVVVQRHDRRDDRRRHAARQEQ